jgi:hypothetical protein
LRNLEEITSSVDGRPADLGILPNVTSFLQDGPDRFLMEGIVALVCIYSGARPASWPDSIASWLFIPLPNMSMLWICFAWQFEAFQPYDALSSCSSAEMT